MGGGDGKTRRALGDIGTVRGVDRKPQQPQISRPLTRSFCAQLLANAQAAAAVDINKKNVCVKAAAPVLLDVPPAGKKAAATPPKAAAQKKIVLKPKKTQEVIEISPDTEQVVDKKPEEKVERKEKGEIKK